MVLNYTRQALSHWGVPQAEVKGWKSLNVTSDHTTAKIWNSRTFSKHRINFAEYMQPKRQ